MIANLFESCGYIATFVGTLLEGEISLLTSVLGAKIGYYNYWVAMALGFLGAWTADWFKYLVARKKGQSLLAKKPKLQEKFDRASIWFDKKPYTILTIYKMLYGTTTLILIMAGLKNISYARFAIHSGISVGIWTALLGGVGYFCAEAMIRNLEFVSAHKLETLGVLSTIALLYWLIVKRPYLKYCLICR